VILLTTFLSILRPHQIFGECIDESPNSLTTAIRNFSERRAPDMEVLVQTSRDLDRAGTLGVFFFLIPVILDGIFQKLAPQIFKPNIISLIQNEEYTFQEAVQRKQLDRMGQLLIVGGVLYSVAFTGSTFIGFLSSALSSS
jgi:kynurenine 3-monooxygenase